MAYKTLAASTVRVATDLYQEVADYAHVTGTSVQEFIANAIRNEISSRIDGADAELRHALEALRTYRESASSDAR